MQVAELGVPYVLMHMRGTPQTMQRSEHTSYGSVWRDVGAELQAAAERAMAAGVPAWNLILDPGELAAALVHDTLSVLHLDRVLAVAPQPWGMPLGVHWIGMGVHGA
jgi:dihydropteroate synthase